MSNEEQKSAGLLAWLAFGAAPLFVALVLGFYKNQHPQISKAEQEQILAPVGKVVAKETAAKDEAKKEEAKADGKAEDGKAAEPAKAGEDKGEAKAESAKADEDKGEAKAESAKADEDKGEAKAESAKADEEPKKVGEDKGAAKADTAKAEDKKDEAKAAEAKKDDSSAAKADAGSCKATVEANDQMQFNLSEITIDKAACPEFTVEIKHVGSMDKTSMGHNVVISKEADKDGVVNDGTDAGIDKDFVKSDDGRVLAHTKLIGGGETAEVKFKTDGFEVGGSYDFFCTYPGHAAMMTGKVVIKGDGAAKQDDAKAKDDKAADKKEEAKADTTKAEDKKDEAKADEAKKDDSSAAAAGGSCKTTVEANDQMQFNLSEITIDKGACPEFTVEIKHVGSMDKASMGHNVVITKEADKDSVVSEGIDAGIDNDFVKPDDKRVLAHTKLVGGGETAEVKFKTDGFEAGSGYDFFCSYPGHAAMMTGKVVVK